MHLASRCPLKTRPEKIVGSVAVKISATGGAQPRTGMGQNSPVERQVPNGKSTLKSGRSRHQCTYGEFVPKAGIGRPGVPGFDAAK